MFMKRVLGLGMVYSCLFSFPYDIYFFPCYSFFLSCNLPKSLWYYALNKNV